MNQVQPHDFCTYCGKLHMSFVNIWNDIDKWHPVCSDCYSDILDFIESLESLGN